MINLLASVSPIALPATIAMPPGKATGAPSLAAFIDMMIGQTAAAPIATACGSEERQTDADGGKDLPDDGDATQDPALAWLMPPPILVPPVAVAPIVVGAEGALSAIEVPPVEPTGVILGTGIAATTDAIVSDESDTLPADDAAIDMTAALRPSNPDTKPSLAKAFDRLPPPMTADSLPPTPARAPAAALPALFALATAREHVKNDPADPIALGGLSPATTDATATTIIAPIADAQRQTLDMGRQDWPRKMIDHIETLRDHADANDTSIRLKPEALGSIAVALRRHDDGAVSVRFIAEQPATRALIADAAPQLREAAEARGIRLSGTSVDLSNQGNDQRARPGFEPSQTTTNHIAEPSGDDTRAVGDDGRIA